MLGLDENPTSLDSKPAAPVAASTTPMHTHLLLGTKTIAYSDPRHYTLAKDFIECIASTLARAEYGGCPFTLRCDDSTQTITAQDDPEWQPGRGIEEFEAQMVPLEAQWQREEAERQEAASHLSLT